MGSTRSSAKRLGILPFEDGFESGDTGAWSTMVP